MTKRLVITTHPSSAWFTHHIASAFVEWSKSGNHETELLDLYDPSNSQSYFQMDDQKEVIVDTKTSLMQQKITWADELIFVFPIWWGSMPAVMKNWIDVNFLGGFAFRYLEWGKVEKLLAWKTVRIYCTCDAPAFIYRFPFHILTSNIAGWSKFVFGFCGLKVTCFEIFGNMRKQDEQARQAILEKVKNWAK